MSGCRFFLFIIFLINVTSSKANLVFDISSFGAKGDGKTMNTKAIQNAINKSALVGGVVLIPKGVFLTGSIKILSNVTIHLETGAILLGSPYLNDYANVKLVYDSYTNRFATKALLYAEDESNITIKGDGIIDGQGAHSNYISHNKTGNDSSIKERPYVIKFVKCRNVNIRGITLRNAAAWMQYYLACNQLLIDGIKVYNHGNYNNDGMDIDNCKNVQVNSCFIDSDDDGICLKSTNPGDTCSFIAISNCIVSSNCNGFKTGTDSQGGFSNITLSNCIFKKGSEKSIWNRSIGQSALAIESVDGGFAGNILINNVNISGYAVAVFLRLGDRGRTILEKRPSIGKLENVQIHNLIANCESDYPVCISGIPQGVIKSIIATNWQITNTGGGAINDNIPSEKINSYPEYSMFGKLPSYGLYMRHVKDVVFQNITFRNLQPDERPCIILSDVDIVFLDVYSMKKHHTEKVGKTDWLKFD